LRPLDAHIAGRDTCIGEKHELADIAGGLGEGGEPVLNRLEQGVGDAQHDARLLERLVQAGVDDGLDLGERIFATERGHRLAHDGAHRLDRPALDIGGALLAQREQRGDIGGELGERRGGALLGGVRGLGEPALAALGEGGAAPGLEFSAAERRLGRYRTRLLDMVEAVLEQVFGRGAHQYTISSSPSAMTISPRSARSLATPTRYICASSTSLRRTGPMPAISSRSSLAARSDILVRKRSRSASDAPLSASGIFSFSAA